MKNLRKGRALLALALMVTAPSRLAAAWSYSSPLSMNMQVTVQGNENLSALLPGASLPLTVHCTDESGQWWRIDWVWLNGSVIATSTGTTDWWGWPALTVPTTPGNYSFTVACQDGRGVYQQQVVSYTVVSVGTPTASLSPSLASAAVGQAVNLTITATCGMGVERFGCLECDANGYGFAYPWDFGGTGTSSTMTVSFTPTASGTRYFRPYAWSHGFAQITYGNTVAITTPPPSPPTVSWPILPPSTLYLGTWFPVRATGSDIDGNLAGIWVEYSADHGVSWTGLAYDPAGVNGGDGFATTSNNNGITAGGVGTPYRFRAYAYDGAGLNSGWQEYPAEFTVADRPPVVALAAAGLGTANGGQQIDVSVPNGTTVNFTSTGSDPDGNFARIRTWLNYNNQGWGLVRDDANPNYSWSYALNGVGLYAFHSRSLDSSGVESATAIVNLTAANRSPVADWPGSPGGNYGAHAWGWTWDRSVNLPLGAYINLGFSGRDPDNNLVRVDARYVYAPDWGVANSTLRHDLSPTSSASYGPVAFRPDRTGRWSAWSETWDASGAFDSSAADGERFDINVVNSPPASPSVTVASVDYAARKIYVRVTGSDADGNLTETYLSVRSPDSAGNIGWGNVRDQSRSLGFDGWNRIWVYDQTYEIPFADGINGAGTYWFGLYSLDYAGWPGAVSASASVEVNRAPTISYDGIAGDGIMPNAGYATSTMTFWGTAADADGNLDHVELFVDGAFKGRASLIGGNWSYTASCSALGLGIGSHTTAAYALDAAGAFAVTATASFSIDNRAPDSASMTASATTFYTGQTVTLYGRLTDPDGNLAFHSIWWDQGSGKFWTHPQITWDYPANATGWSNLSNVNGGIANRTDDLITANWSSATAGTYNFRTDGHDGALWSPGSTLAVNVASRPSARAWSDTGTGYIGQTVGVHAAYTTDAAHGDAILETRINLYDPNGHGVAYPNGGTASAIDYALTPTLLGNYTYQAYLRTALTPAWTVYASGTVTVANQAPNVTLIADGLGAANGGSEINVSVANGSTIALTSNASDPDGNYARTRTWVNYNGQGWVALRDDANPGYGWTYTLNGLGTYQFHSRSIDVLNLESATAIINLTATDRAPTISLSVSPATIAFGETTTVTSVAADLDSNLTFHGILALFQDGSDWCRSPRADHSMGWGSHPTSDDFVRESYTSGAASGGTDTRWIVHRPSWTGTITYHSNAYDGSLWESSWYPAAYATVLVTQAAPDQTGWSSRSWTGTGPAPDGAFAVVFSNPYSGAVTAPTGAPTFTVVSASGNGASPATGTTSIGASTPFAPGTYLVRCSYPGDANYLARSWDVTFAVGSTPPTAALTIKGLSSGSVTAAIDEVLTVNLSGADSDTNLRALNLWVLAPNVSWRNIRSDGTLAPGYTEDQTNNNAINAASGVASLGPVDRAFTITPGQGIGTYRFVARSIDATGQTSASQEVDVVVGQATPTVSWAPPVAITYGTPLGSSQLSATASVEGSFSYSPSSGAVLPVPPGGAPQTLAVTFTPADTVNYRVVTKTVPLTVNRAPLTVKARDASRVYQAANPAFAVTYSGFVNGDTDAVVGGSPSIGTPATAASDVGAYPITPSLGSLTAANYSLALAPGALADGTLTITPQPVVLTFDPRDFIYDPTVDQRPRPMPNIHYEIAPGGVDHVPTGQYGAYHFQARADGNYTSPWVDVHWTIVCCIADVDVAHLTHTYDGQPKQATATTRNPSGLNVAITYDGATAAPTSAGEYAVVAKVFDDPDEHGNWWGGETRNIRLVITPAVQTPLTVQAQRTSMAYGEAQILSTSGGSGNGDVSYQIVGQSPATGTLATLSNNVLTATASVGSVTIRATKATGTDGKDGLTGNYLPASSTNTVTISFGRAGQAALLFTPAASQVYGSSQLLTASGGSGTGLTSFAIMAQDPAAVPNAATIRATASGPVLSANTGGGWVDVRATRDGDENYLPTSTTVRISLRKATPTVTWANPANIIYGTALGAAQLNASADVPGEFAYSPATGEKLAAGDRTLAVTFSPAATTDYEPVSTTVQIEVLRAFSTLSWADPASIVYGTVLSSSQLNATADVDGTFEYHPAAGATLGAGAQILSVDFRPADRGNYLPASKQVSLNVTKGSPIIAWARPASIVFGTPLSTAELSASASVPGIFSYSPPLNRVLSAGEDQILSATFAPADSANYRTVSASVLITVEKDDPAITWPTPAPIFYRAPLSGTQLNATAIIPGSFAYEPVLGTVLATGDRELSLVFTPADLANYNLANRSVTLRVDKAVPVITWPQPTGFVYGTPLTSAQLNATADVPGSFVYTPAAGAVLGAGSRPLSLIFTPADAANYQTVSADITIAVAKADPVVTWLPPAPIAFGTSLTETQLNATADVPGTMVYTPAPGSHLASGEHTLFVAFTPTESANYNPVSRSVTLRVDRADPVIAWLAPEAIVYGTPLDATQLNATANVPGSFVYTPAGGAVLAAGGRNLTVTFAPADSANYATVSATVPITVTKAAPVISWPVPAPVVFGTLLGDGQLSARANVAGTFAYMPGAGARPGAGDARLSVIFTPDDADNYASANGSVILHVDQAAPTITWPQPAEIVFGTPLSGAQLNATANAPGAFSYTPGSGTILDAGDRLLTVAFTPDDAADYSPATGHVSLSVAKAPQAALTLQAVSTQRLGASQTLSVAGGSSGGAVSYAITSLSEVGAATLTGALLRVNKGIGWVEVRATMEGNANHLPVTSSFVRITFAKAIAPITLGNLTQTYSGSAKAVAVTTVPGGLAVTTTYAGSSAGPVDAGSYPMTATINDLNYEGSASDTLVILRAPQTVAISPLAPSIDFGQAITLTAGGGHTGYAWGGAALGTDASVTFTPTSAGRHTATVFAPENSNYERSNDASVDIDVLKVTPTGSLAARTGFAPYALSSADLSATFAHPVNRAVAPPTGQITYSTNTGVLVTGTVLGPGVYTVAATYAGDANYGPATVTAVFTIQKSTPSISWNPARITYGANYGPAQMNATAAAPAGQVSGSWRYWPTEGSPACPCGPQTLSVVFTPDDTANYTAAEKTVTVAVDRAPQEITISPISSHTYGDLPFQLVARSDSGLPVGFSVQNAALVNATTLQITQAGPVIVTATQPGNESYQPATATTTFNVAKASQSITFPAPNDRIVGTAFDPGATASSGLSVVYSVTQGSATVSGHQVSITAAGGITLVASQPGDANYNAAAPVSAMFNGSLTGWRQRPPAQVSPGNTAYPVQAVLDLAGRPNALICAKDPITGWTGIVGGGGMGIITTPPGQVVFQNPGIWQLLVVYGGAFPGTPAYNASLPPNGTGGIAPDVPTILIDVRYDQTITFPDPTPAGQGQLAVGQQLPLNATASSGLPVRYTVTGPAHVLGSAQGNWLSLDGPGAVVVTAAQDGNPDPANDNYRPAPPVSRTFSVSGTKLAQTINFPPIAAKALGDPPFPLAASSSSGLPVTFSIVSGPATLAGALLTLGTTEGWITVQASAAGEDAYLPASAQRSFPLGHANSPTPPDSGASDAELNAWAQGYHIDPSHLATSDANRDGVSDLEEFNLWRDPTAAANSPQRSFAERMRGVSTRLTFQLMAKGPGTVTIGQGGQPHRYVFTQAPGVWATFNSSDPAMNQGPGVDFSLKDDVAVPATVEGTVSDYMLLARFDPLSNPRVRSTQILLNDHFGDGITKQEIEANGGALNVMVHAAGILPFGAVDLSRLETARTIQFGLGADLTGLSVGSLTFNAGTYAEIFSGGGSLLSFFAGPARIGEVRMNPAHPSHFQVQSPAGYVDVQKARWNYLIRYFANGSYPVAADGFLLDFSAVTPLSAYQFEVSAPADVYADPYAPVGAAAKDHAALAVSMTRTTGADAKVFEFRTDWFTYATIEGGIHHTEYARAVQRQWASRSPGAGRAGLTELDYQATREVVFLNPNFQYYPYRPALTKRQFAGATRDSALMTYESFNFNPGDEQLLGMPSGQTLGTGADVHLGYARSSSTSDGPWRGTLDISTTGGGVLTEFYQNGNFSNLGTETHLATGKPKQTSRSFLDSAVGNPSDLISTYDYWPDLYDGKTLLHSEVVTQNGATIGRTDYAYAIGTLNGSPTLDTTVTAHPDAGSALITTRRTYSSRLVDAVLRDRPVSTTAPDGTQTSYAYQRGIWSDGAWLAAPAGQHLLIATLTGKSGSGLSSYRGESIVSLDLDPNKSVVAERILDPANRVIGEASYVYTGGSSFAFLQAVTSTYDPLGNLTGKIESSGRVLYAAGYVGFRKEWESDEQGITLTYVHDSYDRVKAMTRAAASDGLNTVAATTTTYVYDEIGRIKSETLSAAGTAEQLVTSYTYDTASRPKSTTAPGGFTTSINYDSPTQTTTTLPDLGTKVVSLYVDGRTKSVTGTAVADSTSSYAYDATTGNLQTTATTAGQSTRTETDWLNRPLRVTVATWGDGTTPGTRVTTNSYNSLGLLASQTTASAGVAIAPKRRFEYDLFGRLSREGSTTGASPTISVGSDYGVQDHESGYQIGAPNGDSLHWFRYDRLKVYPYDGAHAAIGRYASQTYAQVNGLDATTVARSVIVDADHNLTETTSTLDRAARRLAVTSTTTGTSQTFGQVSLNGLTIKTTNAQGQTTLQRYDPFGRLEASDDPRIGTSDFEYWPNTTLVKYATTPDNKTTGYAYDAAGRVSAQTNPDNKTAYFRYDPAGNLTHQWGDTVNPIRYEHNELGQRTKLHTYRSGDWTAAAFPAAAFAADGDVTTWNYQSATGLLISKLDATGQGPGYDYNALGQVTKRTDARGVVTTYGYNPNNLLETVHYNDGVTTDLAYDYDRNGRKTRVDDAAGTRTFGYYDTSNDAGETGDLLNKSARLKTETLPTFLGGHTLTYNYQYDTAGRANGAAAGVRLDTGSLYDVTYGYDAVLRLDRVTYDGGTPFHYDYVTNGNLIRTVSQGSGYARNYVYEADLATNPVNSNRFATLKHQWGADPNSAVETRSSYDPLGRRNAEKMQGTACMTALGRSTEAGVQTDYSYTDPSPENRVDRSELRSSGKYILAADWSIHGPRPGTERDFNYDPIGNRTSDQGGSYTPNTLNQYSAAPGIDALGYDLNGNLTDVGRLAYAYDAENRLSSVTQDGSTWTFRYDYLGRRIEKSNRDTGATRYLYDGWNLIAELDGSGAIQRRYVWGLDVSLTLQGAGGVSGLLMSDENDSAKRYPIYDASHNVVGLYDGSGATVAAYEYDPFGNLQTAGGAVAGANPFRSATKYTDDETGLVYYGMRFYSPALGRFINRDPIEEQGGANLYAFCGNDGVNRYDRLGMDDNPFERIRRGEAPSREGEDRRGGPRDGDTRSNGSGGSETYHPDGPAGDAAWYNTDDNDYESWKATRDVRTAYLNAEAMRNTAPSSSLSWWERAAMVIGLNQRMMVEGDPAFQRGLKTGADIGEYGVNAGLSMNLNPFFGTVEMFHGETAFGEELSSGDYSYRIGETGLAIMGIVGGVQSIRGMAAERTFAKAGPGVGDGAGLSRAGIIAGLEGTTAQAGRVAAGLRNNDLGLNLLGDGMFEKAWRLRDGRGSAPQAFALGEQLYLRSSSSRLLSEVVHEGTHGLDYLRGSPVSVHRLERRAYFYERQFQMWTGATPEFTSPNQMMQFIFKNY